MSKENNVCPNTQNIIIMGTNKERKVAMFFNPKCGQWACPVCGEEKKEYWIHQATRGSLILLTDGHELQFVTLTGRGYFTPAKSIHFFRTNWPKMRKRVEYDAQKRGMETGYFLVPERHASGVLHAHLITLNAPDSKRWWKDNAYAAGLGYMADVKPILSSGEAVGYVTKYLHKNAGDMEWPKGFMRVRHSQNWPIAEPADLPGWTWQVVQEREVWLEKGALLDSGYKVIDKLSFSQA